MRKVKEERAEAKFAETSQPVSIYVNYQGERKSRSPRCSVGKVGTLA